ncbi:MULTISPECIES: flavin reductase [unclassified Rhizobium]|uniref:flavin reductase n=1 Tax=unclassified Rhizobium TaxID=2613769 RepID=UPI00177F1708|nr:MULTISPECIES: flavin reductase [unclassified Rhizobium]MBD8688525.1 flavin reductase [Rhizobium sp. CFBP 13644]MBD8692973.1 flavin reductase [Rhizobium sp. CFBP 13717]
MNNPVPLPKEAQDFRNGMSRLGAAVNLVTTDGPAGRHGLTVSAVCSVTDTPPTLLVCINRNAFSHDAFIENGVIGINVLASSHQELSRSFARWTGEERFSSEDWIALKSGAPILADASVAFDCKIVSREEKGTHSVIFCEVLETSVRDDHCSGLIWFDRDFHTLPAAAPTAV